MDSRRTILVAAAIALVGVALFFLIQFIERPTVYFVRGSRVGGVHRDLPTTGNPIKAALEALAEGPTPEEFVGGWRSAFPRGTHLRALTEGSWYTVMFEGPRGALSSSRDRDFAAAQVGRTLARFPEVRGVKILYNGQGIRYLLQPILSQLPIQAEPLSPPPANSEPLIRIGEDGRAMWTKRGALEGKRVAINPGHGWMKGRNGRWMLQRGDWWGINEDALNAEIAMLVEQLLREAGATVIPTREPEKSAGIGISGFPKWQESAKCYAEEQDAPGWVWRPWSGSEREADLCARPYYAAWRGADIFLSIHNNGAGGTGTQTFYDSANGFQGESRRLSETIQSHVVRTIRHQFMSSWRDRGATGVTDRYWENLLCQQPSALIEIAFMDRRWPDNAFLQRSDFRKAVARAIYEGICDYFGEDPTYKSTPTMKQKRPVRRLWKQPVAYLPAPQARGADMVFAFSFGGSEDHEGQHSMLNVGRGKG